MTKRIRMLFPTRDIELQALQIDTWWASVDDDLLDRRSLPQDAIATRLVPSGAKEFAACQSRRFVVLRVSVSSVPQYLSKRVADSLEKR